MIASERKNTKRQGYRYRDRETETDTETYRERHTDGDRDASHRHREISQTGAMFPAMHFRGVPKADVCYIYICIEWSGHGFSLIEWSGTRGSGLMVFVNQTLFTFQSPAGGTLQR